MMINESNIEKKPDCIYSFPLQETPNNSKTTELLPKGATAGIDLKRIPVHEDDVTNVLRQRWIACYLLYDWTLQHADHAFYNNKCMWVEQVYKRLEGVDIDAASLGAVMTDTFNQILLEDVEDFIQTHMRVWKCGRLKVEFQVAKTIAKIFAE
ncbi:MAG: hypothetical protein HFH49_16730 [Lachnospiraceae bacterium]|nr:hypothetical protein [Lachnospiraceae bacterium]